MVGSIVPAKVDQFGRHFARRALQVLIAPDGLGAPVAAEGATARGGHVQAEVTMRTLPHAPIFLDVDQVPGGQRHVGGFGQLRDASRAQRSEWPGDTHIGQARDPLSVHQCDVVVQPVHQRRERGECFAVQHCVGARGQVFLRGIRGVRAGGQQPRAACSRQREHFAGGASHAPETHLAEEVVVVLVEQHHLRLEYVELALEACQILRQHGIEQRHLVPGLAQHGGHLQRGQRWIGFGAFLLLLVETQEIGMANQDGEHAESIQL